MEKKVSVIVPVYNVEQYLSQCLVSIINQSYQNIEIILINDGSPDNSPVIINQFAEKDSRFKVINKKNGGISAARNSGIQVATGDYIVFVDSDDWIATDYIQTLVFQMEKDVDLVLCSYSREFKNSSIPRKINLNGLYCSKDIKRRLIGLINEELSDPSQSDSIVTVWAKLYKTRIIKDNHLFFINTKEIGTAEDLLFNLNYLSVLEEDRSVFCIDKSIYFYRKNLDSSFTNLYKSDLFEKWQNLFLYINKYVKDEVEKKAFYNRICLSIIGLGINETGNPKGIKNSRKKLKKYLNHSLYLKAFSKLEFNYFPIHWKLFFIFAKYRLITPLLLMLIAIKRIIKK